MDEESVTAMKHDVDWTSRYIGTCRACGMKFDVRRSADQIVLAGRFCVGKPVT